MKIEDNHFPHPVTVKETIEVLQLVAEADRGKGWKSDAYLHAHAASLLNRLERLNEESRQQWTNWENNSNEAWDEHAKLLSLVREWAAARDEYGFVRLRLATAALLKAAE